MWISHWSKLAHPGIYDLNLPVYHSPKFLAMKADLYIRVSTDEQADKGYSQRDQDDRLRKYCDK